GGLGSHGRSGPEAAGRGESAPGGGGPRVRRASSDSRKPFIHSGQMSGMRLPSPPVAARRAGVRYITDRTPGYSRRRHGKGFVYRSPTGAAVTSGELIQRFGLLVIPPAWTNVWISPSPDGHIQATGLDAKGR